MNYTATTAEMTTAEQLATYTSIVAEPDDILNIRLLPSGANEFVSAANMPAMDDRLTRANRAQDVYVGVNPRKAIGGTTADDVALARCLFVDFDDDAEPHDVLAAIFDAGLPAPSLVIHSGHGVHGYWRLVEPITDLAEFTRLQKGLIALLGSDKAIHDPPRIMRLPGLMNVKREPHVPCCIVEANGERHDIELFRERIPKVELPAPQTAVNGHRYNGHTNGDLGTLARATAYTAKVPGSGEPGRNSAAFRLSATLTNDFTLPESDAWPLVVRWNQTNTPPLDERELRTTFNSALKSAKGAPGSKLAETHSTNTTVATAIANLEKSTAGTTATGKVVTYRTMTAAELDAAQYTIEYLIDWVLVAGQPCIIAGPKKACKTTILCAMALALATGKNLFAKFAVKRDCRVLFMTGESGLATIQETMRRIADSMNLTLGEVANLIISDELPQFGPLEHIQALRALLADMQIEVLMVDPAYLCMATDGNESSLFAMGSMLKTIANVCQDAGVTLILAHHTKQHTGRDRYDQPELEDISWAGFQEFARQWILLARRERYEPGSGSHRLYFVTGGSAGHSGSWGLDIDEGQFVIGQQRRFDVRICTTAEIRQERADSEEQAKADKQDEKINSVKEAIYNALRRCPGQVGTLSDIRARAGRNGQAFSVAFSECLDEGTVVAAEPIVKGNHRPYEAYTLATAEATDGGLFDDE